MKFFRIIVCGNVDFNDYNVVKENLDKILTKYSNVEIVSGHAKGVDSLGEQYANENSIPLKIFPAEWNKYGKRAGPIRNSAMIEYALLEKPIVIAFWNGKSRGTMDTIKKAKAKKIKTIIILH